jgi:hypothetical protein
VTPGDFQNRRREPPEDCVCSGLGRIGDAACHRRCAASLPYYVDLPPHPEAMRLARELSVLLAANHGG